MIRPADIANPARKSGYDHVGFDKNPKATRPYHAQVYGGKNNKAGHSWQGPPRATALEAAQDYCHHLNSNPSAPRPRKLKTAGHKYSTPSAPTDPEVAAALGVLRDARAQRQGKQGYVYLIVEDLPGGALVYGKIGYSTNPPKRVAELQTGNPRKLRLHLMKPGTEADEAALHVKYAKHNKLQEWFSITRPLLLEWDASHLVKAPAA